MNAVAPSLNQADNDLQQYMHQLGQQAREAAAVISMASTHVKNEALEAMADAILANKAGLLAANAKDMEAGAAKGLDAALLDRLELNSARIDDMAEGLRQVATLPDPVGSIAGMAYRPSGIQVGKMRVPIGVIGIIYESRPNVTADAAALCLKSGNAAVLRGGSEARESNLAIADCIRQGLEEANLPATTVQVLETTDRAAVDCMANMPEFIDVIVPRGGKSLVARIIEVSGVPVIKHLDGICHVYIDDEADMDKALAIAVNSKTQRYGTCNTMETLLVAEGLARIVLPLLAIEYDKAGVELRGCDKTCDILPQAKAATNEDWDTEYLAPILSIRVVVDMSEAIAHIRQHSSGHTESIVTQDYSRAQTFLRAVDSSSVMVNASTRFADGFEYGLGAEIGISTDKLHARGPVGLEGLTTEKYVVMGDGHIRS